MIRLLRRILPIQGRVAIELTDVGFEGARFRMTEAPLGLRWKDAGFAILASDGESSAVGYGCIRLLAGQPQVRAGDRFEASGLAPGVEYTLELQFGNRGPSFRYVFQTTPQWFQVV